MTLYPSVQRERAPQQPAYLQFVDEAHAEFFDLGLRALAGSINWRQAASLRDRMLPLMDLSEAHRGCAYMAPMGGAERRALRGLRHIAVQRFTAWAMEFSADLRESAGVETGSLYDPDLLLEVLTNQARFRRGSRRPRP